MAAPAFLTQKFAGIPTWGWMGVVGAGGGVVMIARRRAMANAAKPAGDGLGIDAYGPAPRGIGDDDGYGGGDASAGMLQQILDALNKLTPATAKPVAKPPATPREPALEKPASSTFYPETWGVTASPTQLSNPRQTSIFAEARRMYPGMTLAQIERIDPAVAAASRAATQETAAYQQATGSYDSGAVSSGSRYQPNPTQVTIRSPSGTLQTIDTSWLSKLSL